jgi:transcriptional regulator with XRE-family HTH domain
MLEPGQLGQHRNDLAQTLRSLRKEAGLTGDRLASRCNMSQSKVSKIETGKLLPSAVDVELILRALEAPDDLIDDVVALARLANTEFQDVRSLLRKGLDRKQHELAGLEASATRLCYFLPAMITSLISTPEYIRASLGHLPADVSKTVTSKLDRQAILYDESRTFTFILTESAARWALCPPRLMALQADRLISLSRLPNVRIGVLPAGLHIPRGPLNTFTIYDDRIVTAETFGGAIIMRDPRDVAYHLRLFEFFTSYAQFDDDARGHLEKWASACRETSL